MKIIEVFPIYNEIDFLCLRSQIKKNTEFNYHFIPAILDCNHQGAALTYDLKLSYKSSYGHIDLEFFHQTKEHAKAAYLRSQKQYSERGFGENWMYELGQRRIMYDQLLDKFEVEGFPDILILSDADEILFNDDFLKIVSSNDTYFRCAMDWFIANPTFMYLKTWPGSLVLVGQEVMMQFLKNEVAPMHYHLSRADENCSINAGKHLTYFGGKKEFRDKCKRIAEASSKRVRLAAMFGPLLLKCSIDPMLRIDLKIKKVKVDPELQNFCLDEWGTFF